MGSHYVALDDLELTVQARLLPNSCQSSYLLLSAGINVVGIHTTPSLLLVLSKVAYLGLELPEAEE